MSETEFGFFTPVSETEDGKNKDFYLIKKDEFDTFQRLVALLQKRVAKLEAENEALKAGK